MACVRSCVMIDCTALGRFLRSEGPVSLASGSHIGVCFPCLSFSQYLSQCSLSHRLPGGLPIVAVVTSAAFCITMAAACFGGSPCVRVLRGRRHFAGFLCVHCIWRHLWRISRWAVSVLTFSAWSSVRARMYDSIGGMPVSRSSAVVGEFLKPPVISLVALFCSSFRWRMVYRGRPVPLSPIPHTSAPKHMVGRITAVYRSLVRSKERPQVEPTILVSAVSPARPLSLVLRMCSVHFNFLSTQTPRTRRLSIGCPAKPGMFTVAVVSAFCCLVRCISWYLSGAKDAPDSVAHSSHILCICSRERQLVLAFGPQVIRLVSSTKPIPIFAPPIAFTLSRSGAMKRRNRIGERGEPCGMPVSTCIRSVLFPSKAIDVVLSLRNPAVIWRSHSGSPFRLAVSRSLVWDTLSNALERSRLSTDTILLGSAFHTLWAVAVSSVRAVVVDLLFRAPYCVSGSRLCDSSVSVSLFCQDLLEYLAHGVF